MPDYASSEIQWRGPKEGEVSFRSPFPDDRQSGSPREFSLALDGGTSWSSIAFGIGGLNSRAGRGPPRPPSPTERGRDLVNHESHVVQTSETGPVNDRHGAKKEPQKRYDRFHSVLSAQERVAGNNLPVARCLFEFDAGFGDRQDES